MTVSEFPKRINPFYLRRDFGGLQGSAYFLSREILSITAIKISENGEPGKGAQFVITVPKDGYQFISDESKNQV